MSRLKEFTVSKQVIVPKGQYDNIKLMQSLTYEVVEGDETLAKDIDMAWAELNLYLSAEEDQTREKANLQVEPTSKATGTPPAPTFTQGQSGMCPIHKVPYTKSGTSARGAWSMHKNEAGEACFGSGYIAKK